MTQRLRRLILACLLGLAATAPLAAMKDVPTAAAPPPGTPALPKLPPPPDWTAHIRQFPKCSECRVALAYLIESFDTHCHRPATAVEQQTIVTHPNFKSMTTFVAASDRLEAKGRYSRLAPGDTRRSLTLKAKFLIEEMPCGH